MTTAIVLTLLALLLLGYVALPLVFPGQSDPLPSRRDPVLEELREEKEALLRAIRELDGRTDLPAARRAELRQRYEAKAAQTLRAIDDAEAERAGRAPARPAMRGARRLPVAAASLLVIAGISAVALSDWVLPRVGADATVTSFFEEDLAAAERLRDLQRAAEREPGRDTLLALAEAYWQLQDVDAARDAYRRVVDEVDPVPAVAYRRLALLALPREAGAGPEGIAEARRLLDLARAADPNDPDTLATLGEVAFAQGDYPAALSAWRDFVETQSADADADPEQLAQARARLELLQRVAPAAEALAAQRSAANLMALADAFWQAEELQRALTLYFEVLTEFDPTNVKATARTGEALFLAGRTGDAVDILARAVQLADASGEGLEPRALLFLGNARFNEGDDAGAITAWERYLTVADAPGRVPELIERARARQRGEDVAAEAAAPESAADDSLAGPDAAGDTQLVAGTGDRLYQTYCAACHGAAGQGSMTVPPLLGDPRVADRANVADAVRWGRGAMPGYNARLSDAEIAAIVEHVVTTFGEGAQGRAR